jgi:hypothetical protein
MDKNMENLFIATTKNGVSVHLEGFENVVEAKKRNPGLINIKQVFTF